ncbi:MFS transporter [Anaerolentibacter hominis]|uniref:MFS transporter n=1 Tax=Anaerolentibacter hominis TaxID=3079009 RepID=UPI0031B8678A
MKRKAYVQLILGTLGLLCLGVAYAWSIFVSPLESAFGWDRSQTSMIFTVSMFCFYLGNIASGFVSARLKARTILLASAVLYLSGFFLASNTTTLFQIYIFYGVFCGFGTGIAYNNILKTVNSWFTSSIGKSSGIMLMGFGSGSMVLGAFVTMIIQRAGWSTAFRILGILFAVLFTILAFLLKDAPKTERADTAVQSGRNYTTGEMLKKSHCWYYFFWGSMLVGVGLATVGHASSCIMEMVNSPGLAALYTGLLGVANGAGRVIFGTLYDKIGYEKNSWIITVINTAAVLITAGACFLESPALLLAGFLLVGVSFGGSIPCISAYTKEFFGLKHYGSNVGIMIADGIPSTLLGPYLIGTIYSSTSSYGIAFSVIFALCIGALILLALCTRATAKLK